MEPPISTLLKNSPDITTASCKDQTEVDMSNDLLMEILVRLPFKPMTRFKCVSKSWCEIISGDHLRRRLPLLMSALYFPGDDVPGPDRIPRYAWRTDGRLEDCNMRFFPLHDATVVLDACNGLLLRRSPASMEFYVVDPMARRWVALPRPLRESRLSTLAFDPCNSRHYYVINFTGWRSHGATLEVFSSETGRWVQRDAEFGLSSCSLSPSTHYCNGVLYVLAYPDSVVCMSLAEFTCVQIKLPAPAGQGGRFGHHRGHLHYMDVAGDQLKIWVLKDMDACGWELKHAVGVEEIVGGGDGAPELRFLALHPGMEVVVLWLPWELVCYDLRRGVIEERLEFGRDGEVERNRVIKIWLFPFSCYLCECLADDSAQVPKSK